MDRKLKEEILNEIDPTKVGQSFAYYVLGKLSHDTLYGFMEEYREHFEDFIRKNLVDDHPIHTGDELVNDKNKTDIVKNVNELLVGSKADLVIVNDVSQGNSGFQSDFNEVTIYSKTTSLSIPRTSKSNIAHAIINSSVEILNSCN